MPVATWYRLLHPYSSRLFPTRVSVQKKDANLGHQQDCWTRRECCQQLRMNCARVCLPRVVRHRVRLIEQEGEDRAPH
jgi:hypothetical protein